MKTGLGPEFRVKAMMASARAHGGMGPDILSTSNSHNSRHPAAIFIKKVAEGFHDVPRVPRHFLCIGERRGEDPETMRKGGHSP